MRKYSYFITVNGKTILLLFFSFVFSINLKAQNFLYAKALNNPVALGADVYGRSITTDATGNIYATGNYAATADFNPGASTVNMTSSGSTDIFITKYDGNGNYIFAKSIGGTGADAGYSIAVDAFGNIYTTGYFSGTVDFDPGTSTASLTSNASSQDIFIAKYDASGNYIYAKAITGAGTSDQGLGIALDGSGNVYVTGIFSGTVDFDPGISTVNLSSASASPDIFIAKYDANGNYVYANAIGGTNTDYGNGVAVDASGNAYIVGYFLGTVDFDPGASTANLVGAGSFDIFIAKYDASGNYIFAKALSGTGNEQGNAIALDASSNIYVTGLFSGTTDFDPDAGVINVNSSFSSNDIFLAKYDASGNYIYAKAIGGSGSDYGLGIAVDAAGNSVITGIFNGTADFDPSGSSANLTSAGSSDIFIAAYDASGNYVYAKKIGNANPDFGYDIALDGSGNSFTTGVFSGTVDFDPDAGVANLSIGGTGVNTFVTKLDNTSSHGWANQLGSYPNTGYSDAGRSIAVDAAGNNYVTGYFSGTVDFDPGTGVNNLTSTGSFDIFFAKYDASGNYVFAKRIGGSSNDDSYAIAVDVAGNTFITGYFSGTVDFDPDAGTANLTSSSSTNDIFIAKYDASGNYVYAKAIGSTSTDHGLGISIDGSGNAYITGYFAGTVDFDPGAGTASLVSAGSSSDIFIAKYDASGNYVYAKSIGSTTVDNGNSIAVDASGNVYITGVFNGTVDFDPGGSTANLTSAGNGDVFVAKYDASGNYVYAKNIGGSGTENGNSIKVDASGNIYITGVFSSTVDFDPGAGTVNLTSAGSQDIFIAKYDASGNYSYAKSIGSTGIDYGYSVAIDASGNAYVTGTFIGTADFNPGASTENLTSVGGFDGFIIELDASGNYVFAKVMGGSGVDNGYGIAVDQTGNAYVTGSFTYTGDFDPTGGSSSSIIEAPNSQDVFIAKYGPVTILPVQLLNFSAKTIKNNEAVEISWSTSMQLNNAFFEIERSKDGLYFEKITRTEGCTLCNAIEQFNAVDNHPYQGRSYYRLKQVDIDGQVAYSKAIQILITENAQLKLYPTITHNSFYISLRNNQQRRPVLIRIANAEGIVVIAKPVWLNNGNQTLHFNLANYATGMYYISIYDERGKKIFTSSLIKVN
jgi:hypothetical protein